MNEDNRLLDYFVAGGTMSLNSKSYIKREADNELLHRVLAGEFCNVLTARQMGKSSLMIRTASQLEIEGVRTVIIDLTTIGVNISSSEWYFGIISRILN